MKRTIAALFVASLALAALASTGASAKQAPVRHCKDTYFAPEYFKVREISARGTGCTVARGLSLAYMRATTLSSGAHAHTGHCFGAHSYGHCSVQQKGKTYDCFHFNAVPAKTQGLVRCTADKVIVKFNVGAGGRRRRASTVPVRLLRYRLRIGDFGPVSSHFRCLAGHLPPRRSTRIPAILLTLPPMTY